MGGGGEREEGKKKKMKKCPRQLDFFFSQPPLPLTPCNHAMPSLPRIQGSKMIPFQQKEKKDHALDPGASRVLEKLGHGPAQVDEVHRLRHIVAEARVHALLLHV